MGARIEGGRNIYGYDIGIIILDSTFPRIPGDVGNALTWDFPVLYRKVEGANPKKVVTELTAEDTAPFIEAAVSLEKEGVRAITTSCGFLSLFQKELSGAVGIPVLTSALLMVPLVHKILDPIKQVGILTAHSGALSRGHLEAAGMSGVPSVIKGLQDKAVFTNFTQQNWQSVDIDLCREELVDSALELINQNRDIGALVLECANMPPFTKDIQKAAGLPVFDIVALTNMVYRSFHPKSYF